MTYATASMAMRYVVLTTYVVVSVTIRSSVMMTCAVSTTPRLEATTIYVTAMT